MNATETSSSLPGLFALLGQNPQEGLESLMNPGGEGESFSALMSGLLPVEGQPAASTATPLSSLAMLQTLPQGDQSLPLNSPLMPDAGADLSQSELSGVDDLLGRIRDGQQPLPWRMAASGLSTESGEDPQTGAADLAAPDSGDEEAAALLAMVMSPQVQPLPPEQAVDGTSAATGMGRRSDNATQLTAALSDDGGADDNGISAITDAESGLTADDVDFFLPDEEPHSDKSQLKQQNLQTQGAPLTPAAPTALSAAITAAQAQAADDTSATSQVADAASQSAESHDLLSPDRLAARDKLDFGQDRREWGGALGARIVTMVAEDVQQARIQLDPPELGSLEIKLQVNQDQASVQVQAQNPQVREVLEANAHRLRDALASQGLTLSGFDVSDQSQAQAGQQGEQGQGDGSQGWTADSAETVESSSEVATSSHALLDTFA